MNLEAMDAKAAQGKKENAMLLSLVQEQQRKIKELLMQSKNIIEAMTKEKPTLGT